MKMRGKLTSAGALNRKDAQRLRAHYANMRAQLEQSQRVITFARKQRGWTQAQLAKKLFVVPSAVSRYENGICKAPWEDLERIMPELAEMRQKGCMAYCPRPQLCVVGKCRFRRNGRPCK